MEYSNSQKGSCHLPKVNFALPNGIDTAWSAECSFYYIINTRHPRNILRRQHDFPIKASSVNLNTDCAIKVINESDSWEKSLIQYQKNTVLDVISALHVHVTFSKFIPCFENRVDPDQLASAEPADQDALSFTYMIIN